MDWGTSMRQATRAGALAQQFENSGERDLRQIYWSCPIPKIARFDTEAIEPYYSKPLPAELDSRPLQFFTVGC